MKSTVVIVWALLIYWNPAVSQDSSFFQPAAKLNQKRLITVVSTEATLYVTSMAGLNALWYKNYPRSSFHSFNDNKEWLQMDKAGHFTTSYYIGRLGIDLLRWSGVENKKAIWYGGLLGSAYQSTIELLDGFSTNWGFSHGDFAANTLGSALAIGQELAWADQRATLKFSFHKSGYAVYRPQLLGNKWQESIIKDYNGQTYWLSLNIASFLKEQSHFPKWLNVAIGYGADGMIGGTENPIADEEGMPYPDFTRTRQYYFSLDADLSKIKTKHPWLNAFFETFGFLKIPAPALELSNGKLSVHPLYF